jgi:hypothetical protein
VDREHVHNLFDIESPLLGVLATALTIALTGLLLAAWAVAIRDLWQTEHAKPGSTADIGGGGRRTR